MRLQLRPGLYQVWRRPGRLQIGLDPRHGVVLDGLMPADEAVLATLRTGGTRSVLVREAVATGGTEPRALRLLAEIRAAGLVTEASPVRSLLARIPDDVRRRAAADVAALGIGHAARDPWQLVEARRRRRVVVSGLGRTGLETVLGLAAAGVGTIGLDDPATVLATDEMQRGYGTEDVGRPREDAARDILLGLSPSTRASVTDGPVDLVVVVAHGALDPGVADRLMSADVAHLAVVWGEAGVVVGPLVVPGRSSCLRCQHLHRTDRDAEWPRVVAQISGRGRNRPERTEEGPLATLAATLATGQVLAHLDGARPAAHNASLEASLPARGVALRPWPPHARCGCVRLPAVADGADTGTMAV